MVTYISTPEQLQAINNNLTGQYELINDIDLQGVTFLPIGDGTTSAKRFKGSINGKGFKIKNLTINRTTANNGLFGMTENATIQNVALEDVNVVSTANYNGGLVGYVINTTISNCYTTGYVKGNFGVGGLVGWFTSTTNSSISNCYSTSTIDGVGRCGGLVGNIPNVNCTINNAYAMSQVTATNTTYPARALIGDNTGGSTSLSNLYYNSDILNVSQYGTPLTTSQFADSSNFPTFDTSIWGFANYPYLKVFGTPSLPAKQITVTLNSHSNMLNQFVDVSKRKLVVSVSSTQEIDSRVSKQLITNITSIVEDIVSNIEVKENANIKSYTVDSELIPIDSSVDTSKKVVKVVSSTIEPIQSIVEVIIPIDVTKPIYANVYAITNNTNTFTLQNTTNTYEIENHTKIEVI